MKLPRLSRRLPQWWKDKQTRSASLWSQVLSRQFNRSKKTLVIRVSSPKPWIYLDHLSSSLFLHSTIRTRKSEQEPRSLSWTWPKYCLSSKLSPKCSRCSSWVSLQKHPRLNQMQSELSFSTWNQRFNSTLCWKARDTITASTKITKTTSTNPKFRTNFSHLTFSCRISSGKWPRSLPCF
mgnify:CR=1 FL=1